MVTMSISLGKKEIKLQNVNEEILDILPYVE